MAIDIDQSFYKTGTATVANGSTSVTGQGTLWTQTCRAGDLFGTHVGDGTRIASIESNTSLTLAYPWQGASQTAADYEIQFTPYDVGYQAAVRKLLTVLASGNIEAFGELIGYEGGVPVFTGVGTLELVDKSEFVTPDPNGNLAELAGIAKQNDQFIVMGDDGSVQLMAISDITDAIADNTSAIADNTSAIANKANISDLNNYLSLSGGQMTGTIIGKTPPNSGNNQHGFYCGAPFGSYDSSYGRSSPFATFANSVGNQFSLSYKMLYSHAASGNPVITYSGMYAFGVLNYGAPNPGSLNLVHVNADNQAIKTWQFSGENGGLDIPGPVSKASGTWKIDHPLDPANKILRHGFVEAPEYVNIYRGVVRLVNGNATVNIDEYFGMMSGTFCAVNTDIMVSSLQNQEGGTVVWPESKMTDGILNITCDDETCNDEIAWMVTGRRRDPYVLLVDPNCERGTGRFITEVDKED